MEKEKENRLAMRFPEGALHYSHGREKIATYIAPDRWIPPQ